LVSEGSATLVAGDESAQLTITDNDIADPNDHDDLGAPGDQTPGDFNPADTTYYGGAGNDHINGTGVNDIIYGGSGDDTLGAQGGDDVIYGGSGNDTINGNNDNDTIVGGYGADQLTGSGGDDKFQFWSVNDAGDVIADFNSSGGSGDDSLEFRLPWTDGSFSGGFNFANQSTATTAPTIIDVGAAGTVGGSGTSIALADVVRWTGTASSMDSVAEVDAFLQAQNGTFDGGVLMGAYTASGTVGIYYDADANSAGGTVLLATLQGITNTSSLLQSDFHIIA
jgi:Ca2+-binding RTX toxin-like protein